MLIKSLCVYATITPLETNKQYTIDNDFSLRIDNNVFGDAGIDEILLGLSDSEAEKIVKIYLCGKDLLDIPPNIGKLKNLEILNLHCNKIKTIKSDAFKGLSKLQKLYLHYNQIEAIESNAFNGLSNLQTLSLYNNQLTTISNGAFEGLPSLNILYLHCNLIEAIKNGAFKGLSGLRRLDLDHNKLTVIGSGVFKGLSGLKILYLHCNSIKMINSGAFKRLRDLEELYLYTNKLSTFPDSVNNLKLLNLIDLQYNDTFISKSTDKNLLGKDELAKVFEGRARILH